MQALYRMQFEPDDIGLNPVMDTLQRIGKIVHYCLDFSSLCGSEQIIGNKENVLVLFLLGFAKGPKVAHLTKSL